MPDDNPAAGQAAQIAPEQNRSSLTLFRRPEKYKIGDDFDLFEKKSNLYFEAVELKDEKKQRLALLFNLSEDAFRLAESIEFVEGDNGYQNWIKQLKSLFERNQTLTEKRHNFHRRTQEPGESVDSFAVALREFGAKCGFRGEEYTNRLVVEKLKKAQQKQKKNYDIKHRSRQSKAFNIGDTVLLKNFRARGLQEKFIGPYMIIGIQEGDYEIESMKDKKRKIVHFNSLKPFKIDYELEEIPQEADDLYSDESEIDESIFEIEDPRPQEIGREPEIENNRPYNLRRNRRPPERYGVPVLDY